ncbi:YoaK family protein [Streptomyces luteireticuli]|uniref:YoaK family protein n=1 Tax=Streptomyces luteireticuli TaxID=173858 RepID=UPI00355639E5
MIVLLTVTGGMLDAISFLGLGQVFVGMMTGNVIAFGFALGGAPHFTELGPLLALIGFGAGVASTARVVRRHQVAGRAGWFTAVLALEITLLLAAALISTAPGAAAGRNAVITVLAVTMGMRCAALRSLAVPELQTTFALTGALIALLHDLCAGSGSPVQTARRIGIVGATGAGAAAGATALTHLGLAGALGAVALAVAALAVALPVALQRQPAPRTAEATPAVR